MTCRDVAWGRDIRRVAQAAARNALHTLTMISTMAFILHIFVNHGWFLRFFFLSPIFFFRPIVSDVSFCFLLSAYLWRIALSRGTSFIKLLFAFQFLSPILGIVGNWTRSRCSRWQAVTQITLSVSLYIYIYSSLVDKSMLYKGIMID